MNAHHGAESLREHVPASDHVMVVLPGVSSGTPYVLFDATGRTVHRGRVDMNGLHELAVKALPSGLYDLRVLGLL